MIDLDKYWNRAHEIETEMSRGWHFTKTSHVKLRRLIFIKALTGIAPAAQVAEAAGYKSKSGAYYYSDLPLEPRDEVEKAARRLLDEVLRDVHER
jgi:hypothetical protein